MTAALDGVMEATARLREVVQQRDDAQLAEANAIKAALNSEAPVADIALPDQRWDKIGVSSPLDKC